MRWTLRRRLLAWIVLPTLVIYVVVLGVTFRLLEKESRLDVQQQTTRLAGNYAERFDGALREAMSIADTTAAQMTARPDASEGELFAILEGNVVRSPIVYGAAMAFEPGTIESDTELFCPYVWRDGGGLSRMNIDESVYDWRTDARGEWYRKPRDLGEGVWSDPYVDEGAGNVLMVTYGVPFYRDGAFRGVTTVDVEVSRMNETVGEQIIGDHDMYVVTRDGTFVYHSTPGLIGENVFVRAELIGSEELGALGREVAGGESGTRVVCGEEGSAHEGRLLWVFFAPIESAGWGFASDVDEHEALAGVRQRMLTLAVALGLTLVLIVGAIWFVSGLITSPVVRMREQVHEIASGNLDARVHGVRSHDEIGDLAVSFNTMTEELGSVVERLTSADRERRDAVIFAMAKLTESRDTDTGLHLERICRYTEIIARELSKELAEIDERWIETVRVTAALHDIGKVAVPDAVLKKAGKLTDEERKIIEQHTVAGGDTLFSLWKKWGDDQFLETAVQITLGHHEKWDGSGYPYGLAGEQIALSARIVAVADVYDALTSVRVYKPAMEHEKAVSIIVEGAGSHFDPMVVAAFERVGEQIRRASSELRG